MNLFRFGVLLVLGAMLGLSSPAQAVTRQDVMNMPQMSPGAIMSQNYMYFKINRQQPYLFSPLNESDLVEEEPLIIDEAGVLNQKRVQGEVILFEN